MCITHQVWMLGGSWKGGGDGGIGRGGTYGACGVLVTLVAGRADVDMLEAG